MTQISPSEDTLTRPGRPLRVNPHAAAAQASAERNLPSLLDARILLVDDDAGAIQQLSRVLAGYTHLRFATGGAQALSLAAQWTPELILLDADMPGMSGFDVFRALQDDPALSRVPVIFITQHTEPQIEMAVFALGAADFIGKPVAGPALRARVAIHLRLKRVALALDRAETLDGLTGVAHRRRLDEQLDAEWARAQRSGQALSLLLADVDHFRAYNESQGAAAGDDCLRAIAQLMQRMAHRPGDLVARYGADEFALLLPDTDSEGAAALAARLASELRAIDLPHPRSPLSHCVTASFGLGLLPARATAALTRGLGSLHLRNAAVSALDAARAEGGDQTASHASKRLEDVHSFHFSGRTASSHPEGLKMCSCLPIRPDVE